MEACSTCLNAPMIRVRHEVRSGVTAAGEGDEAALELAFSKKKADDRKHWLASFVPGTFLDQSVDQISYSDFVNKARARPLHALQLPAHWLYR